MYAWWRMFAFVYGCNYVVFVSVFVAISFRLSVCLYVCAHDGATFVPKCSVQVIFVVLQISSRQNNRHSKQLMTRRNNPSRATLLFSWDCQTCSFSSFLLVYFLSIDFYDYIDIEKHFINKKR
eukprot:m.26299 g.26299  ORF g.26299 m.26299 type:complete len:123 (+) comp5844_c0_seq3:1494-1862(+)